MSGRRDTPAHEPDGVWVRTASLERVGRYVDELLKLVPPLEPEDAIGLTCVRIEREFIAELLPRNTQLGKTGATEILLRCAELAIDAALKARPRLAIEVGAMPGVITTKQCSDARTAAWWTRWRTLLSKAIDRVQRDNWSADAKTRDGLLAIEWARLAGAAGFAPPGVLAGDLRQGVRLWARTSGACLSRGDISPLSMATLFRLLDHPGGRIAEGTRKDREGQLRLSSRWIRDRLAQGVAAEWLMDHEALTHRELPKDVPSDEIDLATVVMAAEIRAEIQRVAADRRRRRRGRRRKLVLDHAIGLLTGELDPTDLARQAGVPVRAVQRAWQRERDALVHEVRRRMQGE
jgi:hypothetical protein